MKRDSAVVNAGTLKGVNIRPMFAEVWARGRYDIPQFASDWLDIDLHEGQVAWMNSAPWADERFLSAANRWGKSMAAAVKHLHHGLYQSRKAKYAEMTQRYITINLSLTLDMAGIVWDTAFMRALDSPLYRRFVVEDECKRRPFPMMVISDGKEFRSEFHARSTAKKGKYLLGRDFDFVTYDEAARDTDAPVVRDDVLLMRLTDRAGRIDYPSTGNFRNWYFQEWTEASQYYRRLRQKKGALKYAQTGIAFENPHIDHDKLKRNEKRLSKQYALQNIYGGFASSAIIFSIEDLERCYTGQDYALPVAPAKRGEYIMAVDWGRKEDDTVVLVARTDQRPAQLVFAKSMGGWEINWDDIYHVVAQAHYDYNNAYMLVDSTGQAGDIHLQTLANSHGIRRMEGYQFGGSRARKDDLITAGQRALQSRWIMWPYLAPLYDQLAFYDRDDKRLETDWAMTWCLLAMCYQNQAWAEEETEVYTTAYAQTIATPGVMQPLGGPMERLLNDHYSAN